MSFKTFLYQGSSYTNVDAGFAHHYDFVRITIESHGTLSRNGQPSNPNLNINCRQSKPARFPPPETTCCAVAPRACVDTFDGVKETDYE